METSPELSDLFSILDRVSDPVTIISPDFVFIWVNEAYAAHMRLKKEDILSMSLEDVIPAEYAPVLKGKYRQIDQNSPTFDNIYPSVLPNGTVILEEWINRGVFDDGGSLKYYYCVANLKEESPDSKRLTPSQIDLVSSTLIHSSLIGIIIAVEENISYINSKAFEILGIGQKPFEELSLTEMFDETLLDENQDNPCSHEIRYAHPDGHDRWLSIFRKKQRYGNKNADVFILEDITERKINEILTRRAKNTLANVMRIAKVGYWEKDFVNDRWIWSNETYDIYNIPRGTVITEQIINAAIDSSFINTRQQRIKTILNEEDELTSYKFEYRIFPWGANPKWIAGEAFTDGSRSTSDLRLYGWIQDISDRKKIENELIKAKEKAVESENIKSVFLANMSHEIRTPLNAILGFSDLLTRDPSEKEKKQYKKIINQSSRLLLKIIDDILDFSSIEAGSLDLSAEKIPLAGIFEEIRHIYSDHSHPGITFEIINPGKDLKAYADRDRLKQVLINLVNNAFKYTEKGKITVSGSLNRDDGMISVTVKDSGIGIPQELQTNIFERFFQADSFYKGTGIGLALSRSIIEQMGGTITVTSQPGEGAEFMFTLPSYRE